MSTPASGAIGPSPIGEARRGLELGTGVSPLSPFGGVGGGSLF